MNWEREFVQTLQKRFMDTTDFSIIQSSILKFPILLMWTTQINLKKKAIFSNNSAISNSNKLNSSLLLQAKDYLIESATIQSASKINRKNLQITTTFHNSNHKTHLSSFLTNFILLEQFLHSRVSRRIWETIQQARINNKISSRTKSPPSLVVCGVMLLKILNKSIILNTIEPSLPNLLNPLVHLLVSPKFKNRNISI